ncbi:MAG TPA: hypothetical protein VMW44_01070 [Candidatus Bathyarchaeia archaeon]|nr:hypothetical protein [Candidatus Bathyarchaeia archaeon]
MENEKQVVEYSITDAALAEMKEMYMPLVITDLDDKEQFDAVHSARMVVRGKRIEVEKKRVELKADALAWGKKVQSEANRIFALIEPIENHLMSEEKKAEIEKKRIEDERIASIKDEINSWEKAFLELNGLGTVEELNAYISKLEAIKGLIAPDLYFEFTLDAIGISNDLLFRAKQAIETRIRLDAEQAERVAESERQAKVKIEQDRIAAEQADAQAKIDKANRKIEAEKAAIAEAKRAEQVRKDREEFERKATKDAEEKAVLKAEQDRKDKEAENIRIEQERVEREKSAITEKKRVEGLRPDKSKLEAFSQFLEEGVTYPGVKSKEALAILQNAESAILEIAEDIYNKSQNM